MSPNTSSSRLTYTVGQRGCTLLILDNHRYVRNRKADTKTYWICAKKVFYIVFFFTIAFHDPYLLLCIWCSLYLLHVQGSLKCRARAVTKNDQLLSQTGKHTHSLTVDRKRRGPAAATNEEHLINLSDDNVDMKVDLQELMENE